MFVREHNAHASTAHCAMLPLLAVLAGCAEERALFVLQNQIPSDECEISAQEGGVFRSRGYLDVSVGQGYLLYPLIRSEITSSTALDPQPERNSLALRRVKVKLDLSEIPGSFPSELREFSVATSGVLRPGEARAIIVEIFKDELAQRLTIPAGIRPTVIAEIQVVGTRLGTNSEVESSLFHYPIELCSGCLVQRLAECPGPDDGTVVFRNACGLPQDEQVTCCNQGSAVICLSSAGA